MQCWLAMSKHVDNLLSEARYTRRRGRGSFAPKDLLVYKMTFGRSRIWQQCKSSLLTKGIDCEKIRDVVKSRLGRAPEVGVG
jgi:hypothetical protein